MQFIFMLECLIGTFQYRTWLKRTGNTRIIQKGDASTHRVVDGRLHIQPFSKKDYSIYYCMYIDEFDARHELAFKLDYKIVQDSSSTSGVKQQSLRPIDRISSRAKLDNSRQKSKDSMTRSTSTSSSFIRKQLELGDLQIEAEFVPKTNGIKIKCRTSLGNP